MFYASILVRNDENKDYQSINLKRWIFPIFNNFSSYIDAIFVDDLSEFVQNCLINVRKKSNKDT